MYPDYTQVDLPEIYNQGDKTWIQAQLMQLPSALRLKVAVRYAEVYQDAYNAEAVSYRQENCARHEANTRLRLFVRDHGRALQGYTAEPPLAGAYQRN